MPPKFLLQFEVDQIMQELNLQTNPEDLYTKYGNRHRYDISKKWRWVSRKLIMHTALSAGSTNIIWYWELTEHQYRSSLTIDE